ncbi:hypothetical protein ACTA71_005772 [Dictyostelium dimigraforme]
MENLNTTSTASTGMTKQENDASYTLLLIADFTSIIGCTLVLLGFWRLKLLRNHITKIITFFCSTSLAKDLISTILTLIEKKQSNGSFQCYLYATVITYGSLACWLWTLCLSFSIYNLIVKREPEPEKFEKYYHVFCWVVPFIMSVIMLSKNVIEVTGNWCWIGNTYVGYRFGLFYGPFLAIWFLAAVLVSLTSRYTYKVIRSSVSDNKDRHMTYQFKLINYIIVFLLCWVFAVINRIVNGLNMFPAWVSILHTYLSVSHGFYASVTFIYNNPLMWRYLASIILIPFTKFGYFVETQHRLEKNKNNNNHSPVALSNNAQNNHHNNHHHHHHQNNDESGPNNYNNSGDFVNNDSSNYYTASMIESFSVQNENSKSINGADFKQNGANLQEETKDSQNKDIEPIDNCNTNAIPMDNIATRIEIPPQHPPLTPQQSLQEINLNDDDNKNNSHSNNRKKDSNV